MLVSFTGPCPWCSRHCVLGHVPAVGTYFADYKFLVNDPVVVGDVSFVLTSLDPLRGKNLDGVEMPLVRELLLPVMPYGVHELPTCRDFVERELEQTVAAAIRTRS